MHSSVQKEDRLHQPHPLSVLVLLLALALLEAVINQPTTSATHTPDPRVHPAWLPRCGTRILEARESMLRDPGRFQEQKQQQETSFIITLTLTSAHHPRQLPLLPRHAPAHVVFPHLAHRTAWHIVNGCRRQKEALLFRSRALSDVMWFDLAPRGHSTTRTRSLAYPYVRAGLGASLAWSLAACALLLSSS